MSKISDICEISSLLARNLYIEFRLATDPSLNAPANKMIDIIKGQYWYYRSHPDVARQMLSLALASDWKNYAGKGLKEKLSGLVEYYQEHPPTRSTRFEIAPDYL